MIGNADRRLEQACDEIIELRRRVIVLELEREGAAIALASLEKTNEELGIMFAFWKSAA